MMKSTFTIVALALCMGYGAQAQPYAHTLAAEAGLLQTSLSAAGHEQEALWPEWLEAEGVQRLGPGSNGLNEGGLLDSVYNYRWFFGDWFVNSREIYAYDEQGNEIEVTAYERAFGATDWQPAVRLEREWTEAGQLATRRLYAWDISIEDWRSISRIDYAYDSEGRRVEQINYSAVPGPDPNAWQPERRFVTVFDDMGRIEEELGYEWEVSIEDWKGFERTEYSYSTEAGESLVETTGYVFNSFFEEWVPSFRETLAYDADERLLSRTREVWENDQFVNDRLTLWTYGEGSGALEFEAFDWDTVAEDWQPASLQTFERNSEGLVIAFVAFNWNAAEEDWVPFLKDSIAYNEQGNILETIRSFWNGGMGDWEPSQRGFYFYGQPVSVQEALPTDYVIYPNPVQDWLQIEGLENGEIELTDLQGRPLLRRAGVDGGLSLNGLPSGLYVLKIRAANGAWVARRLLKQ